MIDFNPLGISEDLKAAIMGLLPNDRQWHLTMFTQPQNFYGYRAVLTTSEGYMAIWQNVDIRREDWLGVGGPRDAASLIESCVVNAAHAILKRIADMSLSQPVDSAVQSI